MSDTQPKLVMYKTLHIFLKSCRLSCIYCACKVEEYHFSAEDLEKQLGANSQQILHSEVHILQGIKFHLNVFHPYRPLLGFLQDLLVDSLLTLTLSQKRNLLNDETAHKISIVAVGIIHNSLFTGITHDSIVHSFNRCDVLVSSFSNSFGCFECGSEEDQHSIGSVKVSRVQSNREKVYH